MNTERLREEIEDELFALAPYLATSRDHRHLPDAQALLGMTGPVVVTILVGLLQAYGYDLIKPQLKKWLPKDEVESQIAEVCHHLREVKTQPEIPLEKVRAAAMASLKELAIPDDMAEKVANAITARIRQIN